MNVICLRKCIHKDSCYAFRETGCLGRVVPVTDRQIANADTRVVCSNLLIQYMLLECHVIDEINFTSILPF